jgi:hypothetical protein
MNDARRKILAEITEADWMGWVMLTARTFGWLGYHTHDSRHSAAGFPDCVFVRGTEIVYAELKSERGKVTATQQEWLDALAAAGAETHVWRPSQQDEVLTRLRSPERALRAVPEGEAS